MRSTSSRGIHSLDRSAAKSRDCRCVSLDAVLESALLGALDSVWLGRAFSIYARPLACVSSHLRMSPTRQAVTRSDSFTGLGNSLALHLRHRVADENGTTLGISWACRRYPASGNASKDVDGCVDTRCTFLKLWCIEFSMTTVLPRKSPLSPDLGDPSGG